MLYLAHLGLALAAQLAWETTPIAPEERLWILALLCLVPFALGQWTRRLYLKGKFRATDRAFAALQHSPVALHALAVLGSGWNEFLGRILGESPGLLGWPGPSALLTLLPFVVYTLLAIEVRARLGGPSRARATRRSHWRMFSATLLPLLVYVLLASLVGTSRRLTIEIDSVGLWNALYSAFLILLFALGVPWLFRRTWDARPLPPGPERDVLHAVSALAGFDGRRLFLWNTGNTASNAAIIGLFPWHRIVVFSDLLLAQLDPRQLACVFAHEIGHAKRRHVLIFAAWALAALFGGELVASAAAPDDPLWNSAILLAAMALWVLGFGWMSRRFELEADIYSLRLMGDADALVGALELVSGPHGQARTSWRHFSTERRVAFLTEAARDPAVGERLERRLRWVSRSGFAALALVLGLQLWGLVGQWPQDRVVVDLRTGQYASAARRLGEGAPLPGALERLVKRARGLTGDPATEVGTDAGGVVPIEELARRARAALAAGEAREAADWLELGELRGDADMALVRQLLSLEGPLEPEPLARVLGALSEPWRAPVLAGLPRLSP